MWNRIIQMDEDRLTKLILRYDILYGTDNWSKDIQKVCNLLQIDFNMDQMNMVDDNMVNLMVIQYNKNWFETKVKEVNKLRTYRLFKLSNEPEEYLFKFL
jgi:hypothetical protein